MARVTAGSGNVFRDLGQKNAAELDTKARLCMAGWRIQGADSGRARG